MEIHGQLNVSVMLWYKSVSLLLLKCVRTGNCSSAAGREKEIRNSSV